MSSLPRLLLFSITLMCKRAKHHYKSTPLRPFTSGQKYCGMLCRSGFVSFLLGSDLHLETISQLVETVGRRNTVFQQRMWVNMTRLTVLLILFPRDCDSPHEIKSYEMTAAGTEQTFAVCLWTSFQCLTTAAPDNRSSDGIKLSTCTRATYLCTILMYFYLSILIYFNVHPL